MAAIKILSTLPSRTDELTDHEFSDHGVRVFVKRDDLIDDEISGNKWRKLMYNVEHCIGEKFDGILTFGGAFSNHLVATAAACQKAGIHSVGIVRGEELNTDSNGTLRRCANYGMDLQFVTRDIYAQRNEKSYQDALSYQYPNHFVVPEGGANYYGALGCQRIMAEVDQDIDVVIVAQGTTTTSIGVATTLLEDQHLYVVPVLKGFDALAEMTYLMNRFALEDSYIQDTLQRVTVLSDYHFGGYGKYDERLLFFIQNFYRKYGIKLDPIYTGKAMYALIDLIKQGVFDNKSILFIHTGGVQGSASIIEKTGIDLYS